MKNPRDLITRHKFFHWQTLILPCFLGLCAFFCANLLSKGWIPNDEGVLAQMATRTLSGEVSHRDFDEPYSGGLTLINAASFKLFGTRLVSMRIPLFAFYLLFLSTLYALARRWLSPPNAALFGFVCLGWGLPAYFAPLPSWYNTFFAGYGTWMLMKHIETDRKRWLFWAGMMGGISFCIKVVGLYFMVAGALFLVYREDVLDLTAEPLGRKLHFSQMILVKITTWTMIVVALLSVLWKRLGLNEVVHYLVPMAALAAVPIVEEFRVLHGARHQRLRRLFTLQLTFWTGCFVPISIFTFYYWRVGALGPLFSDLFVLPRLRLEFAYQSLPSAWALLTAVPFALLLWRSSIRRSPWPRSFEWLLGGGLLCIALLGAYPAVYHDVWLTLRPLVPFLAVSGAILLMRSRSMEGLPSGSRQKLFLILVIMSSVSVVQFPFPLGFYFCYISAFVALAALAVYQSFAVRLQWTRAAVMAAYGVFGILWIAHGDVFMLGKFFLPRRAQVLILPERAGLWVGRFDKGVYESIVGLIRTHSVGNDFILAGPDCPEIYFLSGKRNPTRMFYEFFTPDRSTPEILLKIIEERHIKVVVVNQMSEFSLPYGQSLYDEITRRFPQSQTIGRFRIFW